MLNSILIKIKSFFKWVLLVFIAILLIVSILEEKPCSTNNYKYYINPNMKVNYCNVENEKIKRCFTNVLKQYENLHQYNIHLHQKQLGNSTMKAQPIIKMSNLFTEVKEYKITLGYCVMDSDTLVENIPDIVLEGWFAHELGHISDYEQYSNFRMVIYGIKYVLSSSFKKKVEHDADYIALKKGFKKEIIATKKYILLGGLFSDRYISNINKYYLPLESIEKEPEDTLSDIYHE